MGRLLLLTLLAALATRFGANSDPCSSSPCYYGSCTIVGGGYTCSCEPSALGSTCAYKVQLDTFHVSNSSASQHYGRITFSIQGVNRTLSDVGWDKRQAVAFCKFLGYQAGVNITVPVGNATGYVTVSNCTTLPYGYSIATCASNLMPVVTSTGNPAGALCYDAWNWSLPVGLSRGAVQVAFIAGQPGYLCADNSNFGDKEAAVICRTMNFATGRKDHPGKDCEGNNDDCTPTACKNGGSCQDGVGTFTCTCPYGFSGQLCDINMIARGPCLSHPCQFGECSNYGSYYTCGCQRGFTGRVCEIDIDECKSNPCFHGKCISDKSNVGSYFCECSPGYSGTRCQLDVDECASMPCRHDGNCTQRINGYNCRCPNGSAGANCEVLWLLPRWLSISEAVPQLTALLSFQLSINECISSPCENSRPCIDGFNSYSCYCGSFFTGDRCEIKVEAFKSAVQTARSFGYLAFTILACVYGFMILMDVTKAMFPSQAKIIDKMKSENNAQAVKKKKRLKKRIRKMEKEQGKEKAAKKEDKMEDKKKKKKNKNKKKRRDKKNKKSRKKQKAQAPSDAPPQVKEAWVDPNTPEVVAVSQDGASDPEISSALQEEGTSAAIHLGTSVPAPVSTEADAAAGSSPEANAPGNGVDETSVPDVGGSEASAQESAKVPQDAKAAENSSPPGSEAGTLAGNNPEANAPGNGVEETSVSDAGGSEAQDAAPAENNSPPMSEERTSAVNSPESDDPEASPEAYECNTEKVV